MEKMFLTLVSFYNTIKINSIRNIHWEIYVSNYDIFI